MLKRMEFNLKRRNIPFTTEVKIKNQELCQFWFMVLKQKVTKKMDAFIVIVSIVSQYLLVTMHYLVAFFTAT